MTVSKNGNERVTLGAVDFLQLSKQKRVARVDLADVGLAGIVYVCDISAGKQQQLFGGQKALRVYKDQSREIELPKEAVSKLMRACMVTDGQDGAMFEELFDATEDDYIMVPEEQLIYLDTLWLAEFGKPHAINDMIQNMSNIITNHVTGAIKDLSGLGEDEPVAEKKSN